MGQAFPSRPWLVLELVQTFQAAVGLETVQQLTCMVTHWGRDRRPGRRDHCLPATRPAMPASLPAFRLLQLGRGGRRSTHVQNRQFGGKKLT